MDNVEKLEMQQQIESDLFEILKDFEKLLDNYEDFMEHYGSDNNTTHSYNELITIDLKLKDILDI